MPKASKKAARTNVVVKSGTVAENGGDSNGATLEDWVDTSETPRVSRRNDGKVNASSATSTKGTKQKGSRASPRLKTPKTVSTTLGDTATGDEGNEIQTSKVRRYKNKLKSAGDKDEETNSPSELSRVSTMPPTPFDGTQGEYEEEHDDDEVDDEVDKHDSDEVDNQDTEKSLAAAKEDEDNSVENQAVGNDGGILDPGSPDDNFPLSGGYDEDNDVQNTGEIDDDMAPPPAREEDSSDDETEDIDGASAEMKGQGSTYINGLDSDEEHDGTAKDLDDDNDEGPGFNLAHDPDTPIEVQRQRDKEAKERVKDAKQKKSKKKKDAANDSHQMWKGRQTGNRINEPVPVETYANQKKAEAFAKKYSKKNPPPRDPATGTNIRRSKRNRYPPLEFWRNEYQVYGPSPEEPGELGDAIGAMPIPWSVSVVSKQTPYKRKEQPKRSSKVTPAQKKAKSNGKDVTNGESLDAVEFDSRKLREEFDISDGTEAEIYNAFSEEYETSTVVAYGSKLIDQSLPTSKPIKSTSRKKKKAGAVQALAAEMEVTDRTGHPGYLMGRLTIPPGIMKDKESVGPCTQAFTVCSCQPKSIELAFFSDIEDEPDPTSRFLLGPGDMFRIPPGNSYWILNHSESTPALFSWTIIQQVPFHDE